MAEQKQQKEAGYGDDTPENMFRYLQHEVDDSVEEPTLRRFCEESASMMEWLEAHGAKFHSSLCPFKTSYPTSKYFLYFSGNKKAYPFANLAKPAPRGHRQVGDGTGGMGMTGGDLWQAIFNSALQLGIKFEYGSRVETLLVDANRQVNGVQYRTINGAAGWAKMMHKLVTRSALQYQATIQPLAAWLDRLADVIWKQFARKKTAKARAVILAAGGFTSKFVQIILPIPETVEVVKWR